MFKELRREMLRLYPTMSELDMIYAMVRFSQRLHTSGFTVDGDDMGHYLATISLLSAEWVEPLYAFTETELKLTYTGVMPAGYSIRMSIPVQSSFEELEKFDAICSKTMTILNKSIVNITD